MKRNLMWSIPLLLSAAPALAQEAAATPVPVAKPRKVCRTIEVTGRRVATSICHTKDEWVVIDKADEESSRTLMGRVMEDGSKMRNIGSDAGSQMGIQTPQP